METNARGLETGDKIQIRECTTIEEFDQCIELQREAFALPELEISPRRHLIVTRRAGGWTLGAFVESEMVGFVHYMVAVRDLDTIIGYSHMMAVAKAWQNAGVGVRLKWAQREKALAEGRELIKWTWDPMQPRNAHFNLNRLGVEVRGYGVNFYGSDYFAMPADSKPEVTIDSDRLFAEWRLASERVASLAAGRRTPTDKKPELEVQIPADWSELVHRDPETARREQLRVRQEFQNAFSAGLVCTSFVRDDASPRYLCFVQNE